jgi:hypothetical protein
MPAWATVSTSSNPFTPNAANPRRARAQLVGGLFSADFVAKVGEERLGAKNAQQSNRDEWIFESTLRIGA